MTITTDISLFATIANGVYNSTTANATAITAISVGANTVVNTTQITVGNATVYTTVNSTIVNTGTLTTTNNASIGGSLTVTGNLTISGNVTVIGANNLSIVDNMIYLNSNSTVTNPDLGFAGNYNDGTYKHAGFFRDATDGIWKVFDGYTPEPDASPYIDTSNSTFNIAPLQANNIYVGNTTTYGTINATSFSGTANNASNLGGTAAASYQLNSTLAANVAILTANNANNLNGQAAAYYTNATNITTGTLPWAQAPTGTVNTSGAFTFTGIHTYSANVVLGSSGLSANGGFGTSGHVLHSNGTATYWAADDNSGGTVTQVSTGNGLTGGPITTTGTVSVLANSGVVANTTGVFVNANSGLVANTTGVFVNANSGLVANTTGVFVRANSGIVANATGVYVLANSGVVSNSTGVFVNANTGIVANATGVYVNSAYINTISSNSATYANASITNTFTVGTAAYVVANGNVGIGTNTPGAKLQSAGATATTSPTGGSAAGSGLYINNIDTSYGMQFGIASNGSGWIQQQRSDGTNTQYGLILQPIGGNVGIGVTPTVRLDVNGVMLLRAQGGADGGKLFLARPPTSTTLAGDVAIDINTNSLRIYENGGSFRGLIADLTACGSQSALLHSANFNTYAPTLTGTGASGNWGINITGNAATVTNGVYTTGDQSIAGTKNFTGSLRNIVSSGWSNFYLGGQYNKYAWFHIGGEVGSNDLRIARINRDTLGWEANPFVFDLAGAIFYSTGQIRAPIFYDSDDTNSYFEGHSLFMRGGSPTIYFRDTDNNSAMIHVNSNIFYVLRGGNDTTTWTTVGSGSWPLEINLTNNNAQFGGIVTAISDMRAPIFYDSNNTAFYADPTGQSQLYRAILGPYAGSTTSGGVVTLEVKNNGGTGDGNVAAMAFHCTGTYAMHMHLRNDGIFGIGGWSASAWRWYVNMGNGDMVAAGNVVAYSDPRLKEDITKIDSPVEKLSRLNGVRFRWKDNSILGRPGEYDYGVLANEVQEVFPEIVSDAAHDSPDGDKYKAVAYDKLVPVLIEAVKAQQNDINELKDLVKTLMENR